MIPRICFMFGTRNAQEKEYQKIYDAVETCIAEGVNDFVVGRYGNFDSMALRAVIQAKRLHPHVRLEILTPYYSPNACDNPLPPGVNGWAFAGGTEEVPPRFAIVQANRHMVKNVEYIIAGVYHRMGNSYKLLRHVRAFCARSEYPPRVLCTGITLDECVKN